MEAALEKDDILISILQKVAALTGGYHHALVCRRWLTLSTGLQQLVHVRRLNSICEADLVKQIRKFPNLTAIRLTQSVPRLTDFFLGAVASLFPRLQHLELEGRVYWPTDDTTGEGWNSFFKNVPGLRTLHYSGIRKAAIIESLTTLTHLERFQAEDVTSLPECLGLVANLKSLCIMGHWDSATSLPPSISGLRNLEELTFHSGSLAPLPDEVGSFTKLTSLSLELYHAVTIPESLGRLTQLTTLRLEVCLELIALPASLGNLNRLRVLKICGCPRLRFMPVGLLRPSLEVIELRSCPMLASIC